MVVEPGVTPVLPLAHDTAPTPLLIEHVVALVIPLHDSVDDCPALIVVGLALNAPIAGAGFTVTVAFAVVLPPAPVAVSV